MIMKKFFILLAALSFAVACGSGNSGNQNNEVPEAVETTENAVEETVVAGNDWDKLIDEYEQYADKALSLLQRMAAGDASAMDELQSFSEKASSVGEKLSKAQEQSELTPEQLVRVEKIARRVANAMK